MTDNKRTEDLTDEEFWAKYGPGNDSPRRDPADNVEIAIRRAYYAERDGVLGQAASLGEDED